MQFKEYTKQAERTCVRLDSETHFLHMATGVSTELSELEDIFKKLIAYGKPIDKVNALEEIGDAFWYVANWYNMYFALTERDGVEQKEQFIYPTFMPEYFTRTNEKAVLKQILLFHGDFLIATDTTASSGISLETQKAAYAKAFSFLCRLCYYFGFTPEVVAETNINKLKARYPEKFTSEKALNRDLDTERKILEG